MHRSRRATFAMLAFFPVIALNGVVAEKADFTGTWVLNAMKSKNMGFIAALQATATIKQTDTFLVMDETSALMGQERTRQVRYELTGKTLPNEGSQGEKAETVSVWLDDKLVTTWTTEGANPGTRVTRTETRYLSDDGKSMVVESKRDTSPPVVMVFDRKH